MPSDSSDRSQSHYLEQTSTEGELSLDLRLMQLADDALSAGASALGAALEAMAALEAGAVANPEEGRQVGHYWLRAPELAPSRAQTEAIEAARAQVADVAARLQGRIDHVLLVGIGGSALGPQLVADALAGPDGPTLTCLDNTDPAGFARGLAGKDLSRTLTLVVSKSGGTVETQNGWLTVAEAYGAAGLIFGDHAVAITCAGSALDVASREGGWVATLPMWPWVGGRTSVTGPVGLLPMALLGLDTASFLAGARWMDEWTRRDDPAGNPAAMMAQAWHGATWGCAHRSMVVLPYADRLLWLHRYLQQLVMESLGKRVDVEGRVVHQGLTVYGGKGATAQHAYMQQLLEGPDDCFVCFVELLEDDAPALELEPGITTGDHLSGFLAGTREALVAAGRRVMTLTLPRVDAFSLGALIALFERAVGLYATLVGINAYDQPGVAAGKASAKETLEIQRLLQASLSDGASGTAADFAKRLGVDGRRAFHVLRRLVSTGRARSEGTGLERVFRGP